MNYVKGAALKTMPEIIKKDFEETGLEKWMESLSKDSREIFSNKISVNNWYPLGCGLLDPTVKYCILFYNWDYTGAWKMGRNSADFGLKSIVKFFFKIGSPHFMIKKASKVLPTYYKTSQLNLDRLDEKSASFTISNFPGINKIIKYRIGGWMERALEICGCQGIRVKIPESEKDENPVTKINISWEN